MVPYLDGAFPKRPVGNNTIHGIMRINMNPGGDVTMVADLEFSPGSVQDCIRPYPGFFTNPYIPEDEGTVINGGSFPNPRNSDRSQRSMK